MKKRNTFKGSIGFVMAAAGSAVGLGNIWRFPFLAARDGGGLFLVTYLILALTFGFTLLTTEIAIGRKTRQSPLTAYGKIHKKFRGMGILGCLIPAMILPYYVAIGGWVIKYLLVYLSGQGSAAAEDGYFTGHITSLGQPVIFMLVFLFFTAFIIYKGVNGGIEASSRILMPILIVLVLGIAVFSVTISHTDADGVTRTGLQGLAVYVIPNLKGITVKQFFTVVMDATGQLFYSLSVAMGIMVAYGSYVSDDAEMMSSINQIEFFDTLVAFLAGVMIIPAVYAYIGTEGMEASGPSLMFVTLPKVFRDMGIIGTVVGILFFAMVLFAALSSAISIMEAVVSSLMDYFKISRTKSTVIVGIWSAVLGTIVCLGYNKLYFEMTLPNGAVGQILDLLDYVSNNLLMPIIEILTCILIGWVVGPKTIIEEVEKGGRKMGRKGLYIVVIRFIAPLFLIVLFLKALGIITFI